MRAAVASKIEVSIQDLGTPRPAREADSERRARISTQESWMPALLMQSLFTSLILGLGTSGDGAREGGVKRTR